MPMPTIDRFEALNLTDEEKGEFYRTAPIAMPGYHSLIDAIHDPNSSRVEAEALMAPIEATMTARAIPQEGKLALKGLKKSVDQQLTYNNK